MRFPARVERMRERLRRREIACAVIVPGPNLRYLTGLNMNPSERITMAFVPVEGVPALLLPELERPQAESALHVEAKIFTYRDEDGPERALAELIRDHGLRSGTIAVEHRHMRVLELRAMEASAPGARIVGLDEITTELRTIKDDAEIERLRRAVELTEQLLEKTIAAIEPGQNEREIAAAFQRELLESEAEGPAFSPIVVSGPHGDSPHAHPGSRRIRDGELVTIDCGALWEGYPGDITRVVAVRAIQPKLQEIFQVVRDANAAGREACRPNVLAQDVDRAARGVIERAGYGQYFLHRTGHGLGLEVHEPPYIMEGNTQELRPGMTFTVEPGVYLPGVGGARIEDDMLITEEGAESLTRIQRDLVPV